MNKLLAATALCAVTSGAAFAASHSDTVKIGVLLGYTGPIESLAPLMADAAELAISEINASGTFMDGAMIEPVRADSTCTDASAATAAAERLITADGVSGIVGADCSGVTGAVLANVALPNGMVMISPSATLEALAAAEDNDLFFRTPPSDARQGAVLAEILIEKGINSVALTYTNNDYGKGFAESFEKSYTAAGGAITISAPHDDGKADYSAEVGALASAGGDLLVVLGYADQGGKGVIQAASDTGAFDTFAMGDGMYSDVLLADLGDVIEGSFGTQPWATGEGADAFTALAAAAGVDSESTYTRESYDAAALIALAMQAAGSTDPNTYKNSVFDVANAPGEKILPGELGKAFEILKAGGDIDYVGATGVEMIGRGEATGSYREYKIDGGAYVTESLR